MSTPMITNWMKIDALEDATMDPTLYRQIFRSLMYLVNKRTYISFTIKSLNQFMVEPKGVHWPTKRHLLIYLRGKIAYGLRYARGHGVIFVGYLDLDWAINSVDRNSTSGCCFNIGLRFVSWCTRNIKIPWH